LPGHESVDLFEEMDEEEFKRRFADTALARPGLGRMRRNWKAAWESLGAQDEPGREE
jgi:epoxyqueuosine reductase QueG